MSSYASQLHTHTHTRAFVSFRIWFASRECKPNVIPFFGTLGAAHSVYTTTTNANLIYNRESRVNWRDFQPDCRCRWLRAVWRCSALWLLYGKSCQKMFFSFSFAEMGMKCTREVVTVIVHLSTWSILRARVTMSRVNHSLFIVSAVFGMGPEMGPEMGNSPNMANFEVFKFSLNPLPCRRFENVPSESYLATRACITDAEREKTQCFFHK